MQINEYIKENWSELPKSKFDTLEVVIFHEVKNNQEGWGHHSYEGYGVDKDGNYRWVFSSGCSCSGGPSHEDVKSFVIEYEAEQIDLREKDPKKIDFAKLACEFNSY